MTDTLTAAADSTMQVAQNPYVYSWMLWVAAGLSAGCIVDRIIGYWRKPPKFNLAPTIPLARRWYVAGLLWLLITVSTGAFIRILFVNDSLTSINALLTGICILSLCRIGYLVLAFIRDRVSGGIKTTVFRFVVSALGEALWTFWLVLESSSFTSNFLDLGDGYETLAWRDCFSFAFLAPLALVAIRTALLTITYCKRINVIKHLCQHYKIA